MPFVLIRQLLSQTSKASSVTGVMPDILSAILPFLYTENSPWAIMPERPAKAFVLPTTRNKATIPVVSKHIFFIYYLLSLILCLLLDGRSILIHAIALICGSFRAGGRNKGLRPGTSLV